MVRLKKYKIRKAICDVCKGNGFVKIIKENEESRTHQCWECDSEGEFYVYEPGDDATDNHNTDKFLH
jgi:hypothetical protein|tara:strand:- start:1995 stop:2195 length:201 start_codon:yes stop_codon:yes gene_type:complete